MFQTLLLSAKAQPIRRTWTSSQPIEESVTILSPPSPVDEERKDEAAVRTPVYVPVVAPPPLPPLLPSLPPAHSDLDTLRGKVDLMERRLDALDKSDARTKAGMAHLMTRLEDNVAVIRTSLDAIERNASQPTEVFLKAVEESEVRCQQYCDRKLALEAQAALVGEDQTEKTETELSPPQDPVAIAATAPDEVENELTVEERHLRQRPSCNRVLCALLAVASLPLQLWGSFYAYRSFYGPSPVSEAAFYPAFGATQVYP